MKKELILIILCLLLGFLWYNLYKKHPELFEGKTTPSPLITETGPDGGPVGGPGGGRQRRDPFAAAMTEDGKIELAKLSEDMPEQFKGFILEADANKDGFIDKAEQIKTGVGPAGRVPLAVFRTEDDRIDLVKLQTSDLDKDGFIDEDEQLKSGIRRPRPVMGGPGRPGGGPNGPAGGPIPPNMAKPTDAKPVAAKPTDAKPTDAKPVDAKPADGPKPPKGPGGPGGPGGMRRGPLQKFQTEDGKLDLSKFTEADTNSDKFLDKEEQKNCGLVR